MRTSSVVPGLLLAAVAAFALAAAAAGACGSTSQEAAPPAGAPVPLEQKAGAPATTDAGVSPAGTTAAPLPGTGGAPAAPAAASTRGALVIDGIPEIPAELHRRMLPYLSTREAALADLSDDGAAVLVTTRFGETSQAHLVTQPLGDRRQITFSSEPVRGPRFQPGSREQFLYTADSGGNEQYQLFRATSSGGTPLALTDARSRALAFLWARAGDKIAFSSNARNGRDFDLYLGDGRSAASARLLVEVSGQWTPLDWSRNGATLLALEFLSAAESRLHLVDAASGKERALTPEKPPASYRRALFSADGKRLYVVSDREGEFAQLYEVAVSGGEFRPLTRDIPWDVEEIALSPSGRTLAYAINEGGFSVLYLLDTRSRKAARVRDLPRGVMSGLTFARGAEVLGFSLSSARMVGDAYTYDPRKKKLTRWTQSEIGGLSTDKLAEPSVIEYVTFDGAKVPALYYRPAGQGPFPVLISIHGGPESQSRPVFVPLIQYLVTEKQVAVLLPNVRGSDGYGKTYLTLDDREKREDSVKDIGKLLDWIAERPELDKQRVAVYGGSYGGYMVLASLVQFGSRLRAGIDLVGISSFVTFLTNTAPYRRVLRRIEYGDESDPKMRAVLERISPLSQVGKISTPLFVAQGANDPRVPASEAEQIVKAVRGTGHDVWYLLARNEGHGFQRKENRDIFNEMAALFLEKHLALP